MGTDKLLLLQDVHIKINLLINEIYFAVTFIGSKKLDVRMKPGSFSKYLSHITSLPVEPYVWG